MKKPVQPRKDGRTKMESAESYRELERKILEENRQADERNKKAAAEKKNQIVEKSAFRILEENRPAATNNSVRAFHKTTCRHCGVYVEYTNESEGQMAQCPKCGENVILIVLPKGGANRERTAMKVILPPKQVVTNSPATKRNSDSYTYAEQSDKFATPVPQPVANQNVQGKYKKRFADSFWMGAVTFLVLGALTYCHLASSMMNTSSKTLHIPVFWGTICIICGVLALTCFISASWSFGDNPIKDFIKILFSALGIAGGLVCVSFIFIGILGGVLKTPSTNTSSGQISQSSSDNSSDLSYDAYYTAKQFIQNQYPGAKTFSDYERSQVADKGNGIWWVTVNVDGVNAFNAPIRNTMLAEMKSQNDHWYLVEIDNLNGGGQNSAPVDNPE